MTTKTEHHPGLNPTCTWAIEELRRIVTGALGEHGAEVWLFGSCARGDVMQHSDIDIAILPHEGIPEDFFSQLEEQIDESSVPYHVDLVDLRTAASSLIEEVQREGVKWKG